MLEAPGPSSWRSSLTSSSPLFPKPYIQSRSNSREVTMTNCRGMLAGPVYDSERVSTHPSLNTALRCASGQRPLDSVVALPLTALEPQDLYVVPGRQDNPDPRRDRVGSGLGQA